MSESSDVPEISSLRELTSVQWKTGTAAVLGWLFDGLDMHLYTLVAIPFVAELLGVGRNDVSVGRYGSIIQASFLVGWALGGAFFGVIADRIGRSRALVLTILTYACFTGLSYFAQTWWHLLIFRFLAALGIGGEWAVGASLLSETWPRSWRPWLAAVLQSGVNVGVILACVAAYLLAEHTHRTVFLVGILPAFLVLWIRKAVPEPEEWHQAQSHSEIRSTGIGALFHPGVRRTTLLTTTVCALGLTGHWAIMFWFIAHLRSLPEYADWTDAQRSTLASQALLLMMCTSIIGNFLSAIIARGIGYRLAIVLIFLAYFATCSCAYGWQRAGDDLWYWIIPIGICQGVFALFTMYLPPLFPTLIRSTGAGFCYNIGRLAAAVGTVFFGLVSKVGDYRYALFYAGFLFLPAAAVACFLDEPPDELAPIAPVE
ncbi:MAG: MFS transporter [Planctomycetota bacterium]|nr:MFS transporter [Planctomycetota bacterium]MDA1179665.1 MFS transporter [Planctomycetota bacterium]